MLVNGAKTRGQPALSTGVMGWSVRPQILAPWDRVGCPLVFAELFSLHVEADDV